uniref:(northern house mosquito) hypothetical protein n=1 Tax=Culex pipiens TaxID=7175 RepID=A0A8D8BHZ5_CULPI
MLMAVVVVGVPFRRLGLFQRHRGVLYPAEVVVVDRADRCLAGRGFQQVVVVLLAGQVVRAQQADHAHRHYVAGHVETYEDSGGLCRRRVSQWSHSLSSDGMERFFHLVNCDLGVMSLFGVCGF